jgi:hypothetical protein
MDEPVVTSPEVVQHREAGAKALQPVTRPAHWGVDRDLSRRPGVPKARSPEPWPNTQFPPERQHGPPSSPLHGRPNKLMPPVFGTAVPLRGLSGLVRRFAYRYPDHYPRHWLLLLLGDRVDLWTHRFRRVAPFALAIGAGVLLLRRQRG